MVLFEKFRNKGYLKTLLLVMEHVAKENGIQTVSVQDIDNPDLINTMERYGWIKYTYEKQIPGFHFPQPP